MRGLIGDQQVGFIELVKSSFGEDCLGRVTALERNGNGEYAISVADHVHGMTTDTVINNSMVASPPTSDTVPGAA